MSFQMERSEEFYVFMLIFDVYTGCMNEKRSGFE
jgi:hypothetical protein